ncbi:glycoside hydrolase, family 17 [Afipia carboxidovorans OM5]|uniref:Endo-1,3-beta-glucanase btgC n=1 Tax=Afipia carboxidovorans (strain ATCC 49405 / DSM 1227 / KCTC 32145 / OM5) TaxID=504832 RepID=B6JFB4_AFIC5|nr:beta-1,6-glucan synthase [Afipia carboxidovorans]ACI93333.1 glycoside hydrolase, family 17 [Afipia carboxidovorans OM5]AEI02948.1 putative glycoside hydrolase [Afipia carboxidovorans OM4]AEI06524.1 putative glycoside hydrolase [Afipia carboxidovorans OM5]
MRTPLAFLVLSLCVIAGTWTWLGQPVPQARAPLDPAHKLECVSYTPFRGAQSPLEPSLHVPVQQIAQDLAQLAKITDCIRTYSIDSGLDQVPGEAAKVGLKVIQGIWLGSNRFKNSIQIDTAVALAKRYPATIEALVVGNEVLLRGEMTAADLLTTIRYVKSRAETTPVTYADVWEFWLRNRELAPAVDFVTIHILPYWEDFPVRAKYAAGHVDQIRKRVAVAFPNKEILIGETGWPSAGRMRDGALPSLANQAMVVSQILALARSEKFRVNLIEAYDQPWKRQLEGTVGGYWGLFGSEPRQAKYATGETITNHPMWRWQMGGGLGFCVLVYAAAMMASRRRPWPPRWAAWFVVAVGATVGGVLAGWGVEKVQIESFGTGGWIANGGLLAGALAVTVFAAMAAVTGRCLPTFVQMMGPPEARTDSKVMRALGLALIVVVVFATETALGFVFDPRYRDFQFAALTIAAVPALFLMLLNGPTLNGRRPVAETAFAVMLTLCVVYIGFNEGSANWQSLWTCGAYLALAFTLSLARVAQNPRPSKR